MKALLSTGNNMVDTKRWFSLHEKPVPVLMENSLYYCILTRLEVHHIQEPSQHNFRFKASSKEAPDTEKE